MPSPTALPCDCHDPRDGGPVAGALFPAGTDSDRSLPWVEACGTCKVFATDEEAAAAVAAAVGAIVGLAPIAGLSDLHPFICLPYSEATTIYVVAPTDDSHELAAFTDEIDAERFAETFEDGGPDGAGTDVQETVMTSGPTARRMTTQRRQSQYEEIGESPEQEIEEQDLGRYVVSCGSAIGRREVVHVTAETQEQVLALAAEEVADGWIPNEIHDLNTGKCRRLEITTAVVPVA